MRAITTGQKEFERERITAMRNNGRGGKENSQNAGEKYIVFYDKDGKELLCYTQNGTFPGERTATIELLAHENGIPESEITAKEETR
jgi:hypothetical protein